MKVSVGHTYTYTSGSVQVCRQSMFPTRVIGKISLRQVGLEWALVWKQQAPEPHLHIVLKPVYDPCEKGTRISS